MKPSFTRLGLALLLVVSLPEPCPAQSSTIDTRRMDEIVRHYADDPRQAFMGAVLVARGNDVLFAQAYGMANLTWSIPNTPATKFDIASNSKQFTAAAILLLEERGKLRVTDPIKAHLADPPSAWDGITFHQLLTHTSGLTRDVQLDHPGARALPTRPETIVARLRNLPLDSAPGSTFSYSNAAYQLLAHLIERVSGQPFESFLQQNIFSPLGMQDSGSGTHAPIIKSRASGYLLRIGSGGDGSAVALINAPFTDRSAGMGAGSLYSTVGDMHRWTQALFGGRLLHAESLKKMTTAGADGNAYGLGVAKSGPTQLFHGGSIPGFVSFLSYYPDSRVTVVVLTNASKPPVRGERPAPGVVADWLGTLAHGGTVTLPVRK